MHVRFPTSVAEFVRFPTSRYSHLTSNGGGMFSPKKSSVSQPPLIEKEYLTLETFRSELSLFMDQTLSIALHELGYRIMQDMRRQFGPPGGEQHISASPPDNNLGMRSMPLHPKPALNRMDSKMRFQKLEEHDRTAKFQSKSFENLSSIMGSGSDLIAASHLSGPLHKQLTRHSSSLGDFGGHGVKANFSPFKQNQIRINRQVTGLDKRSSRRLSEMQDRHDRHERHGRHGMDEDDDDDRHMHGSQENLYGSSQARHMHGQHGSQENLQDVHRRSTHAANKGGLHLNSHGRKLHPGPRDNNPHAQRPMPFVLPMAAVQLPDFQNQDGSSGGSSLLGKDTATYQEALPLSNADGSTRNSTISEAEPWAEPNSSRPTVTDLDSDEENSGLLPHPYRESSDFMHDFDSDGRDFISDSEYSFMKFLVQHSLFEQVVGTMVLMNALMQGVEAECRYLMMTDQLGDVRPILHFIEGCFCVVFVGEISLRICAFGGDFFCGPAMSWNLFDFTIVSFQVAELSLDVFQSQAHLNISYFRLLRLLRIVRIARLVRLVRVFEDLETIVSSIIMSLTSLVWTLMLLMMTIYVVSILFLQTLIGLPDTNEKLNYWFGGLPRTMLTMFEIITSGVSWDEVIAPVIDGMSPFMGFILVLYITFCLFALLNMATGVFVETATRKAREDKEAHTANHIIDLFFNTREDEISWEEFSEKLTSQDMQEYFKSINVDPSEAKGLFQLLDADESGIVSMDELVQGLLRLRGGATALELSLHMYEASRMNQISLTHQAKTEAGLMTVLSILSSITGQGVGDMRNAPKWAASMDLDEEVEIEGGEKSDDAKSDSSFEKDGNFGE